MSDLTLIDFTDLFKESELRFMYVHFPENNCAKIEFDYFSLATAS